MTDVVIEGKVWKFGRDVDTDAIIPARYLTTGNPEELGRHCMEPLDADFVRKVSKGDVIVADENFGCGSSREHAPLALRGAEISAVIAKSFARIFYRNAINMGLPIIESPEVVDGTAAGDLLRIDTEKGEVVNVTTGKVYRVAGFPPFIAEIIRDGGLIPHVRKRLTAAGPART